ncbi:40623_t:CDS:1 [Gigaspora margarita]|uniref:40623_t:CDS:1 n=1 Tax=Gigaspora margarita TaxID=4874 RepID=A0ABN7VTK1_GIGMA|nr:40623_t:CDS:1 [Gigaspora margarita]
MSLAMLSMVNANPDYSSCNDLNISPYFQDQDMQLLNVNWNPPNPSDSFIIFNTQGHAVHKVFTRVSKLRYIIQTYDNSYSFQMTFHDIPPGQDQINRRDYVGIIPGLDKLSYFIYVILYDEDPFIVKGCVFFDRKKK